MTMMDKDKECIAFSYQTFAVQDTSLLHGRLLQCQQRGQKPRERGLTLVTHKIFSRLKLVLSGDCLSNTFPSLVLSSLFHSFLNTNTEEKTADLHIWGDHLFVSDKIFLIFKQKPRGRVSKQLLEVSWVDKRLERRQTWGKCLLFDFRAEYLVVMLIMIKWYRVIFHCPQSLEQYLHCLHGLQCSHWINRLH